MAVVETPSAMRANADYLLGYLAEQWRGLSKIADEWDRWDEADRLDFVLDWPSRPSLLDLLRSYAEAGVLTVEQRACHEQLERLVAQQEPLLDRLMAD